MKKQRKQILCVGTLFAMVFAAMVLFGWMPVLQIYGSDTESQTKQDTDLELDTKQTVYFTAPGSTTYLDFAAPEDGGYIVTASGTAGEISIVLADEQGNVFDIEGASYPAREDRQDVSVTSMYHWLAAGKYRIGVSCQRVCKIKIRARKMERLEAGKVCKYAAGNKDGKQGAVFVPEKTGDYIFFLTAQQYSLSVKVLDEDGEVLGKGGSGRWIQRADSDVLYRVQVRLTKGKAYILLAEGKTEDYTKASEIVVEAEIPDSIAKLSDGKEVQGTAADYYSRMGYTFKPKETGKYLFTGLSPEDEMVVMIYDGTGKRISLIDYDGSSVSDSYRDGKYKTESAVRMTAGKPYRVVLRMRNFLVSEYTFKVAKLQPVKRIAITHKPAQTEFLKGMDSKFDLKKTQITIYYKNGKTAKWNYSSSGNIKDGYPVRVSMQVKKDRRTAVFRFRGKTAKISIPVVKICDKYKDVPDISEAGKVSAWVNAGRRKFYRFTPARDTLYGFSFQGKKQGAYFYTVLFTPGGKRLLETTSDYDYSKKLYYTEMEYPLKAGKTYFVGMYFGPEKVSGRVQLTAFNKTPSVPENIRLTRKDNTSAEMSWKQTMYATGYQIKYMPVGNAKASRAFVTIYNAENDISGLSAGKRYQFKVRAYRAYNGKRYYGDWSEWLQL